MEKDSGLNSLDVSAKTLYGDCSNVEKAPYNLSQTALRLIDPKTKREKSYLAVVNLSSEEDTEADLFEKGFKVVFST
ncbi:hypothetical protein CDAR_82691 [Caerostris darwini]|uniref:Uncharacterized protein n=1 Tax=Caerostris darwini TaxID=1538125 RepID=A0AAV4QA97_9ARAC|nr:hypothetical protein CDAR_82691 [Caerostris darwini]